MDFGNIFEYAINFLHFMSSMLVQPTFNFLHFRVILNSN